MRNQSSTLTIAICGHAFSFDARFRNHMLLFSTLCMTQSHNNESRNTPNPVVKRKLSKSLVQLKSQYTNKDKDPLEYIYKKKVHDQQSL